MSDQDYEDNNDGQEEMDDEEMDVEGEVDIIDEDDDKEDG